MKTRELKKRRRSGLHLTLSGYRQKSFTFGWKMSKLNFEKGPKAPIYTEASRGTKTNPRVYTGAHRLAGACRYLKRLHAGAGFRIRIGISMNPHLNPHKFALLDPDPDTHSKNPGQGHNTNAIQDIKRSPVQFISQQGPQYQYIVIN